MVDLVNLSLGAVEIVVFLALSFYCFKLINKFFKGGIFEASFKAFMVTGILLAAGIVFTTVAYAVGLESLNDYTFHIFHVTLEILAAVTLLYGVRRLYLAWTKLAPL